MWARQVDVRPSFSTVASLSQVGLSWAPLRAAGCEQLASAVCSKLPSRSHNEKRPQDYGTSPGARSPRVKKSSPGARARRTGQAAPCNSPAPHCPTWRPSHSRPRSEPCPVWRQGVSLKGSLGLTGEGLGWGRALGGEVTSARVHSPLPCSGHGGSATSFPHSRKEINR